MLSERRQTEKVTYCMIPFVCYIQNRQIYRDRKQISCYQGIGGGANRLIFFPRMGLHLLRRLPGNLP